MRDAIIPYRINHLSLSSYPIGWVVSLLKGFEKKEGDWEPYIERALAAPALKSESRKVPVPPSEMVDMRPDEVPLVEEELGEMLLIEVNRLCE